MFPFVTKEMNLVVQAKTWRGSSAARQMSQDIEAACTGVFTELGRYHTLAGDPFVVQVNKSLGFSK